MKSNMTNTTHSSSDASPKRSPIRRWLLLPLSLALLLAGADLIFRSQSQNWLLSRLQAADSWLLSLFTSDIDTASAARQAIPPKKVIPNTNSPIRAVQMELLAPPELLDTANQPHQSPNTASLAPDGDDASAAPKQDSTYALLQQAAMAAADQSGTGQICRVVLTGTALTGAPGSDGTWTLHPGSLQQTLVIPDHTGALHPAGRLDTELPSERGDSAPVIGTLQLNPQQNAVEVVWTDGQGAAATRRTFQATFTTGTPADLAQGLPVELEPDTNSARFLQMLLAERLPQLLSQRLEETLEASQITPELTTPGSMRIRITADQLSWSFRSAATVRLHRTSGPPEQRTSSPSNEAPR